MNIDWKCAANCDCTLYESELTFRNGTVHAMTFKGTIDFLLLSSSFTPTEVANHMDCST